MKKINTVVIPIAGMGTRFLPITKVVSKEMLNLLDKPIIDYAVEEAKEAGIEKFIFIINKNNKFVENYFTNNASLKKLLNKKNKIIYIDKISKMNIEKNKLITVIQNSPTGLGDAILKAEKHINGEDFCVILPDDLILGANCIKQLINVYNIKNTNVIGVMKVVYKDIEKYGVIGYSKISGSMLKVNKLIEKPNREKAPSNYAIVGRYVLSNKIFKYLKKIKIGSGGEYQLTDAISLYNKDFDTWGCKFKGSRYDCGNKIGFFQAQIAAALEDKEIKNLAKKLIKKIGERL